VRGGRSARVVIVQHSVRRYRAAFFNALRSELASAGVDLRLIHSDEAERLVMRPHKARLPWADVRPGRRLELKGWSLLWQPVLRAAWGADLVILEQASHLLANYLLVAAQHLGGPRVAFWGHGRNFLLPTGTQSGAETAKAFLSRRVHWWFAYNELAAEAVVALGYPRERITVVQNATDTRWLSAQVEALDRDAVAAARRELGLTGANVGLFLGTLGPVKRFDLLFDGADRVRRQIPDFELVIAGHGTEEAAVATWTQERAWAHYAGPRFGDDAVPLLAMAKLLLVPGWAGLVVVDGFAAGLPLVASASVPHPPEISYLIDGVNGRLVQDGGDPARYAEAVIDLLRDERRRAQLVRGCIEARSTYSVEAMAQRFASGVLAAL
jgi:L-malate glycosyltransferase